LRLRLVMLRLVILRENDFKLDSSLDHFPKKEPIKKTLTKSSLKSNLVSA
jgi:hypothetical protein